jgi:hypothetical protein
LTNKDTAAEDWATAEGSAARGVVEQLLERRGGPGHVASLPRHPSVAITGTPAPLDEPSKVLNAAGDRQSLEQILGVDRSVLSDLQNRLAILAPQPGTP